MPGSFSQGHPDAWVPTPGLPEFHPWRGPNAWVPTMGPLTYLGSILRAPGFTSLMGGIAEGWGMVLVTWILSPTLGGEWGLGSQTPESLLAPGCMDPFMTPSLQVNRPLTMRKDGIQTRNRKVSAKGKKRRSGEPGVRALPGPEGPAPLELLTPSPLGAEDPSALYALGPVVHLLPFSPTPHLLGPTAYPTPGSSLA